MTKWIDLGPVSDFPVDQHTCRTVDGRGLVIFHLGDEFFVIRNECPHAGLPLGDGDRAGSIITCPYHGYAYNVRNGRNVDWPEDEPPVQTFAVRVADGRLQIEVNSVSKQPQHQRGPAPTEKPASEPLPCDPDEAGSDSDEQSCPSGYPQQGAAPPNQPSTDEPRPKTPPTRKGN